MTDPTTIVCPACGALNRVPAERSALRAKCGGCHRALFAQHPAEVDEAGFERHARADGIPVLLDVWAPWCGPCRTMAPQFDRAASLLEPDVRLLKLNADEAPERLGPAWRARDPRDVPAQSREGRGADRRCNERRGHRALDARQSFINSQWRQTMTIDRGVLAFAGFMTLASAVLTWFFGPWWLLLTGFVGLNLIQSSVTGFCPAALLLKAVGLKPGAAFQ